MAKSYPVDETRSADAVERTKRQRRLSAKKRSERAKGQKRQTLRKGAVRSRRRVKPNAKKTKQQTCLDLLNRRATIEDLQAATGWQQHSVCGASWLGPSRRSSASRSYRRSPTRGPAVIAFPIRSNRHGGS